MSQFGSFLDKIRHKITQVDIEKDSKYLTARAFRSRVLEEAPGNAALEPLGVILRPHHLHKKVAVYESSGIKLRRALRRISLVVLAPVIGLGLISFIVLNIIVQNQVSAPIEAESIVLGNIPLPSGVRPINRTANINQKPTVDILIQRFIPNYESQYKNSVSYIMQSSVDDLAKYYKSKMVEPRPPPWQIYGTPTYFGDFYTTLFVRPLNAQGGVEAVILQLEPVKKEILRFDQSYYDKKAQVGETVIVISKAWLAPRS